MVSRQWNVLIHLHLLGLPLIALTCVSLSAVYTLTPPPCYHFFCCVSLFILSVFIASLSIVCVCVCVPLRIFFCLSISTSLDCQYSCFRLQAPSKIHFYFLPVDRWAGTCLLFSTWNICASVPKPCMYQNVLKKYAEPLFFPILILPTEKVWHIATYILCSTKANKPSELRGIL